MCEGRQNAEKYPMRVPKAAGIILSALLAVGLSVAAARPAHAAKPYCPSPFHQRPQKVPANLVGRVAKALQIDTALVRGATFVRCAGPTLMACSIGANLVCGKADTRRSNPGATRWCRDNPGAKIVPLAATGHATIFEWSCVGRRTVRGNAVTAADRHGYIAENWKAVP
jgi:hypothetical protein